MHTDAGRCRWAFVATKHTLEQVGLHRLYTNPRAFRRKVERGTGGSTRGEGCLGGSVGAGGVGALGGGALERVGAPIVSEVRVSGVRASVQLGERLIGCGIVGLGVTGGGGASGGTASYNSIDGDGTGTDDGSIGAEGENEGLRFGVDDDDGSIALEVDGVVLLIG